MEPAEECGTDVKSRKGSRTLGRVAATDAECVSFRAEQCSWQTRFHMIKPQGAGPTGSNASGPADVSTLRPMVERRGEYKS